MIRLSKSTQSLVAELAGSITTTNPQVYLTFIDETPRRDKPTTRGSTQITNTNGTTSVTICDSPENNVVRNINYISVYNADSASTTVIISLSDNGTEYILVKQAVAAGETLFYEEGAGWVII